MSRYEVHIKPTALRTLEKLEKPIRRRIQAAIDALAEDPRPAGVITMTSRKNQWRIKVGRDFRVVYEIHGRELIVLVVEIGDRKDVYR